MGTVIYNGEPFLIDPYSLEGGLTVLSSATPTIGGKVVQVYGVRWDDLVVEGFFGSTLHPNEAWKSQSDFLKRMRAIAETQVGSTSPPQQLIFPDRNWNFLVYLKDFSSADGGPGVVYDPELIAPRWRLTFFVANDTSDIRKRTSDKFIERLSKGLGWERTKYNGPLDDRLAPGYFTLPGRTPLAKGNPAHILVDPANNASWETTTGQTLRPPDPYRTYTSPSGSSGSNTSTLPKGGLEGGGH